MVGNFEENLDKKSFVNPINYAIVYIKLHIILKETCKGKAESIKTRILKEKIEWDILIFCDTICVIDDKIIEKPNNEKEAIEMLEIFSNKTHKVHSALLILMKNEDKIYEDLAIESTDVTFGEIPKESIKEYCNFEIP